MIRGFKIETENGTRFGVCNYAADVPDEVIIEDIVADTGADPACVHLLRIRADRRAVRGRRLPDHGRISMIVITKGKAVARVPIENLTTLCLNLCGGGMNEKQTIEAMLMVSALRAGEIVTHKGLTLRIDSEN